MRIEILVATMNQSFDLDAERPAGVSFLIINQTSSDQFEAAVLYKRKAEALGLRVLNFEELGLARSRNHALAAAKGEICIISDDDVAFHPDIVQTVETAFKNRPDVDLISFQADGAGKTYRQAEHAHSVWTSFNVMSIELAFRRQAVRESGVIFDERFGLGAQYVSGEENIFVADLIGAGRKAVYVPATIASHPPLTSGGQFQNNRVVVSKGAIIRRILGGTSYPIAIAFAVRKSWKRRMNPIRLIALISRGWFSMKSERLT